jgi:hypothetical protein
LRVSLRENAFLGVLREAAGKAAGKPVQSHGYFAGVLREYRELVAEVMAGSIPVLLDSNFGARASPATGNDHAPENRDNDVGEQIESTADPIVTARNATPPYGGPGTLRGGLACLRMRDHIA